MLKLLRAIDRFLGKILGSVVGEPLDRLPKPLKEDPAVERRIISPSSHVVEVVRIRSNRPDPCNWR